MIRTLLLATLPNQDHLCAGRNAILHAVAAELSQINIYLATGSAPDFSPAGVKTVR
jgi:cytidine deaminase